jgi:UDP-N-acetyl-D-glucosamine dehydrogenase
MNHPFLEKLRRRDASVGVVGLGHDGLPLAMTFHDDGFEARGLDVDEGKVTTLAAGRSDIRPISHADVDRLRATHADAASFRRAVV